MKMGKKGASDFALVLLFLVVIVVVVAVVYKGPTQSTISPTQTATTTPTSSLALCPSGLQNLQVVSATQVPLNKGILYLNQPIAVVTAGGASQGTVLTTDTDNQGSSVSYKTTSVGCTNDAFQNGVYVYGTASSSFNSANPVLVSFAAGTTAPPILLTSTNATVPTAEWLSLPTYSNITNGPNSATAVVTTSQSISKGTPFTIALQINGLSTGSVSGTQAWGGPQSNEGLVYGIDYQGSSAWKPGDISLSVNQAPSGFTLTPIACPPDFAQAKGVTVCWASPAITGGNVIITVSGSPSGGTPTSWTDNPVIFIKDMQYFAYASPTGSGLKIGYDGYDLGNNQIGQAALNATIVH